MKYVIALYNSLVLSFACRFLKGYGSEHKKQVIILWPVKIKKDGFVLKNINFTVLRRVDYFVFITAKSATINGCSFNGHTEKCAVLLA